MGWLNYLIGVVVGVLIAWLGSTYAPGPFGTVLYVIGVIIAVVCAILLLVSLIRGGTARV